MIFRPRKVEPETDKDAILDLHCRCLHSAESALVRNTPYEQYRAKWLSTSKPDSYLSDLRKSIEDQRTIADVFLDDDGVIIAYVGVTFTDMPEYGFKSAHIRDIAVVEKYHNTGVGRQILTYVEDLVRCVGADVIRAEMGVDNLASRQVHEAAGFKPYTITLEKILKGSPDEGSEESEDGL